VAGLAAYLAAALFLARPLASELTRAVPSHWEADVVHQLWVQWWFAESFHSGRPLFHTDVIHYPQVVNLQLADLNLALNTAFYLIERALGTTLAWNALLLASLVLAGAATWALCARFSGRADAGWLAGLCFAASCFWRACVGNAWLYLVQIWVLPLALLAAWRALRTRRVRDAALAGATVGLAFHVSPYFFVDLVLLGAALAPWYVSGLRGWLRAPGGALRAAASAGVLLALVLPRALPMWRAAGADLLIHSSADAAHLAAQPAELLWPWSSARDASPAWGFRGDYLGALLVALAACGAVSGPRRRLTPWLFGAAVCLLLALGPFVTLFGVRVPLPGVALAHAPGFSLLSNPWRFVAPALLALSLPAAAGAAALARLADSRARGAGAALVASLGLLHVLDVGFAPPLPLDLPLWRDEPAPIALRLRDLSDVHAVLDLSRHSKRNQLVHGKAIVSGWLPRLPRAVEQETVRFVESVRRAPPAERADRLGRAGIGAVIRDDTSGSLIRPDPERPGGFREEPLRVP